MKVAAKVLLIALAALTGAASAGDAPAGTATPGALEPQKNLRWHVDVLPTQDRDVVEVVFRADIASGWILYSSDFAVEIGPRPAKFTFDANPSLTLLGPVEALRAQRKKDRTFNTEYSYFAGNAEFRQKVRVLAPVKTVSGRIDGQTCFEESGLCELFRETFTTNVP